MAKVLMVKSPALPPGRRRRRNASKRMGKFVTVENKQPRTSNTLRFYSAPRRYRLGRTSTAIAIPRPTISTRRSRLPHGPGIELPDGNGRFIPVPRFDKWKQRSSTTSTRPAIWSRHLLCRRFRERGVEMRFMQMTGWRQNSRPTLLLRCLLRPAAARSIEADSFREVV